MSRIGKVPVSIPKDVKITIEKTSIKIEGPKGKLSLDIPYGISIEKTDNQLLVRRDSETKQNRANYGTIRAILNNMVIGVTQGHRKSLRIQGVGYRAQMKGKDIELSLGFSHPVLYKVPENVQVKATKPTEIEIEGADKTLVGQVAAQIRALKEPEPYKGKGIRYADEIVKRKQGKSVTK